MTAYLEKLRDPRWQKKRLKIFERDNWECQECGDPKSTLHVHHEKYHGNPWESPDTDLITLCELCHDKNSSDYKLKQIQTFIETQGFTVKYFTNDKLNESDRDKYMIGFE